MDWTGTDGEGKTRGNWCVFVLSCIQGSHASWKVLEFKIGIFQAWKVMENDGGHGKSRKSHGIPQIGH